MHPTKYNVVIVMQNHYLKLFSIWMELIFGVQSLPDQLRLWEVSDWILGPERAYSYWRILWLCSVSPGSCRDVLKLQDCHIRATSFDTVYISNPNIMGTRDSILGWGTMLQAEGSLFRDPMGSMNLFNLPITSSRTRPWRLLRNEMNIRSRKSVSGE
jgi:hypothetical protein